MHFYILLHLTKKTHLQHCFSISIFSFYWVLSQFCECMIKINLRNLVEMSICVCALVNVCVEMRLSTCDRQISNLLEILNIDGLFISFHKIVHLKHMKMGI